MRRGFTPLQKNNYSAFFLQTIRFVTGFSLIEILVVITVFGLISAIGLVSYSQFNKQARDAKRKADLNQVKAALEMYRSDNDFYPTSYGTPGLLFGSGSLTGGGGQVYIDRLPQNPKGNSYVYTSDGSTYTLSSSLENTSQYELNPYGEVFPTNTPVPTSTPIPTNTPIPPTNTPVPPTPTLSTPTATPVPGSSYIANNNIVYIGTATNLGTVTVVRNSGYDSYGGSNLTGAWHLCLWANDKVASTYQGRDPVFSNISFGGTGAFKLFWCANGSIGAGTDSNTTCGTNITGCSSGTAYFYYTAINTTTVTPTPIVTNTPGPTPSNTPTPTLTLAQTTSITIDSIVDSIIQARNAQNKTLMGVTLSGCTACACGQGGYGTWGSQFCIDTLNNTYSRLGYATIPVDAWGDWILIDENEYEFGPTDCRYDSIYSRNGPSGSVAPKFCVP